MEKAVEGVTTPEIITEEIVATTEEIAAEVKEEVIEAPSRLRRKLRELEAMWERASIQFFQAPKL
jgi:arginine repressor